MPQVVLDENAVKKADYLKGLFVYTYLKDIKERYDIREDDDLEELISLLASNIGGLTNPIKLGNTFKSVKHRSLSTHTIILKIWVCAMRG